MYDHPELAIVIPFFKIKFFREALDSILAQSVSDFHIYIGDDASPDTDDGLLSYLGTIPNLTYHRFNENLGATSLTSHWNRCIDLVRNEQWIWLFSDDDVMSPNCVREFKNFKAANAGIQIFKHDSAKFIDIQNILRRNTFPPSMNSLDFLKYKFNYIYESYAIEYIVHKSLYEAVGGYTDFPLGWCSDDLFWIQASAISPILTIPYTTVYWRFSDENISGRRNTQESSKKKMEACYLFMEKLQSLDHVRLSLELRKDLVGWYLNQYFYLDNLRRRLKVLYLIKPFLLFPLAFLLKLKRSKI
jgi:glycosyltransferase involved in cell wall biosynthesis